jgi:5-(carboxyamino)imidazole ribonucleotide mutase
MGSKTDQPLMEPALGMLEQLGIEYEVNIMSAHRAPARVRDYAVAAKKNGLEVIIAGAGGAAHLPGVLASWTELPVIGIPLPTSDLKGVDALCSIVQMPSGVPVASVGIGNAKNAALLAARILALKHPKIARAVDKYRRELAEA